MAKASSASTVSTTNWLSGSWNTKPTLALMPRGPRCTGFSPCHANVSRHRAAVEVRHQTVQAAQQRGLARAGGPDHQGKGTSLDVQIDRAQDGPGGARIAVVRVRADSIIAVPRQAMDRQSLRVLGQHPQPGHRQQGHREPEPGVERGQQRTAGQRRIGQQPWIVARRPTGPSPARSGWQP